MKTIAIIGCYFGKKRRDASLFIHSIGNNPTIDWIIFSDTDWGDVPENMRVITMTFEDLRDLVQRNFDFKISLETPYKICDYKPAYGLVFHDYIKEYDFWGHCDFDMLFGNLRKFFTEDKLSSYSKIYYQGHLSLYKNNERMNELFKSGNGKIYYKQVFTNNESFVFDEVNGMYYICEGEGIDLYKEIEYADIYPYLNLWLHPRKEYNISRCYPRNRRYQVFGYNNGRVVKWSKTFKSDNIQEEEFAYIHFSHKILEPILGCENFYITRRGLIPIDAKEKDIPFEIYYPGIDEIRMNVAELIFRIKRKIKKVIRHRGRIE